MRWIGLFLALIASSTHAQTSLWEVSKNGFKLYLGGTLHMLSEDDYPLPPAFAKAYESSAKLVLETDLEAVRKPQLQQRMLKKMTHGRGESLSTEIQTSTYEAVDTFMRARGLSIEAFETMKPALVAITLTVMETQRMGWTAPGIDQHFHGRARRDGKSLGQLETPLQHIDFIATMGDGNEDEILLNTLNEMHSVQADLHMLRESWRSGDAQTLARVGLASMQQKFPGTYRSLLVQRNENWLPQIEQMLRTDEIEVVLVGVLHLVGRDGLLQILRSRGYTLTQM